MEKGDIEPADSFVYVAEGVCLINVVSSADGADLDLALELENFTTLGDGGEGKIVAVVEGTVVAEGGTGTGGGEEGEEGCRLHIAEDVQATTSVWE